MTVQEYLQHIDRRERMLNRLVDSEPISHKDDGGPSAMVYIQISFRMHQLATMGYFNHYGDRELY